MLEKELKKVINDNIVDNEEGAITADMLNDILNVLNQNTKHSEDLIVAGKAITLESMPYMWYYSSEYLCFNFRGLNYEDYNVYIDGTKVEKEYFNNIKSSDSIWAILSAWHNRIYRLDHVDGNNVYIVSKPFNGYAKTTMPDVYIENYKIVNKRTAVPSYCGGGIINVSYNCYAKVKYARRVHRTYPASGEIITWKFTNMYDWHNHKKTSYARSVARRRWLSVNGALFTVRYEQ